MPWYSRAEPELLEMVGRVLTEQFPALAQAEIRVDVLCAHPKTDRLGEPAENAITVNGYPAPATINIRGPKERAQGLGDAMITLDAYRWDEQAPPEQEAILHHELSHIELQTSKSGAVKRDDYDRPKLSRRLHDRQFGWFDSTAKRFGDCSQEVQQAKLFVDELGQIYLPGFGFEAKPTPKKRKKRAPRKSTKHAATAN